MPQIATTTAKAVRDTVLRTIQRIVPSYMSGQERSWRHVGDDKRATVTPRVMRHFQLHCEPELEVPDGAYGCGIEYQTPTFAEVGYPLTKQELDRAAGADSRDLTAMLVRVHTQLPGMFPVQVQGREQQLLTVSNRREVDGGWIVTFTILPGLHFFADDQITLRPEGT